MDRARIQFPTNQGETAQGGLFEPKTSAKAPAVLLIQEWWGLNDHVRSIADRLAAEGFLVLAPDLYDGWTTKDAAEAGARMTALDGARSMQQIEGARAFLAAHEACSGKVGIIGFCMGGAFAFRAAANLALAAAVPFYGIPPAETSDFTKVSCPVLAHFAGRDQWAKASRAEEIQKQIQGAGGSMELFVYDADHAFFNDTRPEVYSPDNAKLAWERSVSFLKTHLG